MSNKKKPHLADFETCVFHVYLRNHLSYKNVFHIYVHPCLKSFQIKKEFFKSGHKNQLIHAKMMFCQKKVSYTVLSSSSVYSYKKAAIRPPDVVKSTFIFPAKHLNLGFDSPRMAALNNKFKAQKEIFKAD